MVLLSTTTNAQKKYSVYGVGFYNQENLFDYTHDEGKKDMDFTPNGRYKWSMRASCTICLKCLQRWAQMFFLTLGVPLSD